MTMTSQEHKKAQAEEQEELMDLIRVLGVQAAQVCAHQATKLADLVRAVR